MILVGCSACCDECPIPKGTGCKSLSDINAMVTENKKGEDEFNLPRSEKKPMVLPKHDIKIWIRGYETDQGDCIDDSYAYIKLR